MNERIKELAEQAELNATLLFNKDKLEKFAELIVKECALQCVHNEDMDRIEKHFNNYEKWDGDE